MKFKGSCFARFGWQWVLSTGPYEGISQPFNINFISSVAFAKFVNRAEGICKERECLFCLWKYFGCYSIISMD